MPTKSVWTAVPSDGEANLRGTPARARFLIIAASNSAHISGEAQKVFHLCCRELRPFEGAVASVK
jgi:hypothetical protein